MSINSYPVSSCASPPVPSLASFQAYSSVHRTADVPGFDQTEIGTVLAIAHLTGWSAEMIANKVHEYFGTIIPAETVWDVYRNWEDAQDESAFPGLTRTEHMDASKAMVSILQQHGIEPDFDARPLSRSRRPISVWFFRLYSPAIENSMLIEDFSEETRQKCFGFLLWRKTTEDLGRAAPKELLILERLGPEVANIIIELLCRWNRQQIELNDALPFTKAVERSPENMQQIEKYVKLFVENWEDEFGIMDGTDVFELSGYDKVHFYDNRSTGDATKKFFHLMLVTRLEAMEHRRTFWRRLTGFYEVPREKLPEDAKDCYICRQSLGVPDDDGEAEKPIRVVACCGNFFGAKCLRKWYGEYGYEMCPLCKWKATPSFLDKLVFDYSDDEINSRHTLDPAATNIDNGQPPRPEDDEDDACPEDSEHDGFYDDSEDEESEDGEIKE